MLLAVDIGNTKIKSAVFEGDTLLEKFVFNRNESEKNFRKISEKFSLLSNTILSSVTGNDDDIIFQLKKIGAVTIVGQEFILPFTNLYETPKTLGIDRMVLAAGATLLHPGSNRLIIDAGTCITYDFVDAKNNYLGGAISPGLQLRYGALHNFTAKLPLLFLEMPESYIGNSTEQAIHSGVVNGFVYEIEGFIKEYEKKYSPLTIILTGGDADFLAKRLKNTIFANSNFLLESLNILYKYIIEK